MAERESVKQQINFAKETVHGTLVPVTRSARGFKVNPRPNADFKGWRPQGMKVENLQMLMREWATSPLDGVPNYDEMGYILQSVIGLPTTVGGVAGSKNVHTFRFDNRFEQDIASYSLEYGTSDSYAHSVKYLFFDSFNMSFTRDTADLGGSAISHNIVPGVTMTAGVNEVQDLAPTVGATAGTFKLSYKGQETASITFSSTMSTLATAIASALNALTNIGVAGVTVAANGTTSVRVTFSGAGLAGNPQPMLVLSTNGITGGATPGLTITEFTPGGFTEDAIVPILPGQINVYMADTYATLMAGKLTRARLAGVSIANRASPYWVLDSTMSSFLRHAESPIDMKINLELQANATGFAPMLAGRAGTGKFIRIEAVSPQLISGADPFKFSLECFARVSAFGDLTDNDGVYQSNYEFTIAEDANWGNTLVATLENGKANYAT